MQHPFTTRRFVAAILGMKLASVEVIGVPMGGGRATMGMFGQQGNIKGDTNIENNIVVNGKQIDRIQSAANYLLTFTTKVNVVN